MEDGCIKFNCQWTHAAPLALSRLADINEWRQKLFAIGLIGAYENDIGYGNISVRVKNSSQFIISGTQTGRIPDLNENHYTLVTDFDIPNNRVFCRGPVEASSETLTHAAVYACDKNINAVVHIHDNRLWKSLKNILPTTAPAIPYGTVEMSCEVIQLYSATNLPKTKIFVMGGHEDGLLAFGQDMEQAGNVLLHHYHRSFTV
jgi:L-ribulose-5-phosphate 4-epimerase